ncbi:hypothetical protein G6F57_017975 [Rhizopus arrhizus]|nr:hypothetical protein G6F57_017975 [Rhizopus arrhizus]
MRAEDRQDEKKPVQRAGDAYPCRRAPRRARRFESAGRRAHAVQAEQGGRQRNRERHDQQADQRADQPIDRDAGKHVPGNGAACVLRAAAYVSIDDACRRKQHDQGKQELVHGVGAVKAATCSAAVCYGCASAADVLFGLGVVRVIRDVGGAQLAGLVRPRDGGATGFDGHARHVVGAVRGEHQFAGAAGTRHDFAVRAGSAVVFACQDVAHVSPDLVVGVLLQPFRIEYQKGIAVARDAVFEAGVRGGPRRAG